MRRSRTVTGPDAKPATGADWTIVPSTGEEVYLLAIAAVLVTSAVAGNRAPTLQVKDKAGNLIAAIPAPSTQATALTVTYSWVHARGPGAASSGTTGGFAAAALPDFWLPEGWSVGIKTINLDVGDAWAAPNVTFRTRESLQETYAEFVEANQ